MGVLSSTASITRFMVDGAVESPIMETVAKGLKKHAITEIDNDAAENAAGWTSFENPFKPDFEGSSFSIGAYMVFSLRIDKKSIPPKIIKKYCAIEAAKMLSKTGRDYLSANEKKMIKDHVINVLSLRIPATPNLYDIVWNYEASELWFFSNLKSANETLETLFTQSFGASLIRLFPYTMADLTSGLSNPERDALNKLLPTSFSN